MVTRDNMMSFARLAGDVKRYHTWPVIRQQTNADHSWNCLRIYTQIWGVPSFKVMLHLMFHDLGELGTGDIPFPLKRNNPALKEALDAEEVSARLRMGIVLWGLDDVERLRVKLCDLLEMNEYGHVERKLGNAFAQPVCDDTWDAFHKLLELMSGDDKKRVGVYLSHTEWLRS